MPINPLIALQGRPVQVPNIAGNRMALAHADLYEQQAAKARQDAEDEAAVMGAIQSAGGQLTPQVAQQVAARNPRAGMAIQQLLSKQAEDQRKAQEAGFKAKQAEVALSKDQFELQTAKMKRFANRLSTIKDDVTMRRAIYGALADGDVDEGIGQQFLQSRFDDPATKAALEQFQGLVTDAQAKLEAQYKAAEEARKVASEGRAQSKETREAQEFQATLPGKTVDPKTGMTKAQQAQFDQGQQSPDIREYNFAVQRGEFKGTFPEWQAKMANLKAPRTTVNTSVNMPRELFKDESALRKELDDAPEVKSYSVVREQVSRARQAMQSLKGGGSANAADQVIVTVLNKVLDPASVVRESEYARTAEGQSLLNRLSGYASKLASGGAGLSGSERQVVMGMIERLGEASRQSYEQKTGYYRGLAKEYGFNPDRVVRPGGGSAQSTEARKLTPAIAADYVAKAGGDAKKAREMAARDGYK